MKRHQGGETDETDKKLKKTQAPLPASEKRLCCVFYIDLDATDRPLIEEQQAATLISGVS